MKELDIRSEDELFFYDDFTVVGACRAYWMFKAYGKLGWIMNGTHSDLVGSGLELESGEMTYEKRKENYEEKGFEFKENLYKDFD